MISRNRSIADCTTLNEGKKTFLTVLPNTIYYVFVPEYYHHEDDFKIGYTCNFHSWLWIRKILNLIHYFHCILNKKSTFQMYDYISSCLLSCVMSCQSTQHFQKKFLNILNAFFWILNIITIAQKMPYCLFAQYFLHCLFLAEARIKAWKLCKSAIYSKYFNIVS